MSKKRKKERQTHLIHLSGKNQFFRAVLKDSTLEEAKELGRELYKLCDNPTREYIQNEDLDEIDKKL